MLSENSFLTVLDATREIIADDPLFLKNSFQNWKRENWEKTAFTRGRTAAKRMWSMKIFDFFSRELPIMTSSRRESVENSNFHFYQRPKPPCGSGRRFDYKTTRSQVLSLKVNYTVNCAVNCCNRVLHFLRFRKTCGVYFASKTPKNQYILSSIVWKF